MSTIEVTNINDVSGNASLVTDNGGLKTDKLTGKTTAGSISVVGEGNSTTTNLQQGLAKGWCGNALDSSQAITGDTFNVSGFTDVATGYSTHTLTNNMATGANTYPVQCTPAAAYGYHGSGLSTSSFQLRTVNSTGNSADGAKNGLVHGDLA